LGTSFLGEIPIYTPIRLGGDIGKPIVTLEPQSEQSKNIRQIARSMAAQISIHGFDGAVKPAIEISLDT
jgi:hypothetical protein